MIQRLAMGALAVPDISSRLWLLLEDKADLGVI